MSARLQPLHYFAYGSNMNPARVAQRRLATVGVPQAGELDNFALRFNKISRYREGGASANIVAKTGCVVTGVLYELEESQAIEAMDRFENAPADYAREVVFVRTLANEDGQEIGSLLAAWTYIAKLHAMRDDLRPSKEYIRHLLASPFISGEDAAKLRAIKCLDD